jgi:hypothetical protein
VFFPGMGVQFTEISEDLISSCRRATLDLILWEGWERRLQIPPELWYTGVRKPNPFDAKQNSVGIKRLWALTGNSSKTNRDDPRMYFNHKL